MTLNTKRNMHTTFANSLLFFLAIKIDKIQSLAHGKRAHHGEFPYHVSVRYHGEHTCSGAFVLGPTGEHLVVTLATCVLYAGTDPTDLWALPANTLDVVAGRITLRDHYGGEQVRKVRRVRYHKGLWRTTHENDIAVLFLVAPFSIDRVVAPVSLAIPGRPRSSVYVVTGWGESKWNGQAMTNDLKAIRVGQMEPKTCYDRYYYDGGYNKWAVFDSSMCLWRFRGDPNQEPCKGDEGSPAVGISEGDIYLAGIFQWTHGNCGSGFPAIFADMMTFGVFVDIVALERNNTPDGVGR